MEDAHKLLGSRVFTFSAHASEVKADGSVGRPTFTRKTRRNLRAMILDARPLLGEMIAVFGQGLFGLLVTGLLIRQSLQSSGRFGTLTTFDPVQLLLRWERRRPCFRQRQTMRTF